LTTGKVVQVVNTQTGAVATTTTVMQDDDTIPQNTEGGEFMTLAITPTSASNKLVIEVIGHFIGSYAGAQSMIGALFQDSTANALATSYAGVSTAYIIISLPIRYYMTAGTTSATTFKFRAGSASAGTTTFNGRASARKLGGVMLSSMTITEIAV